MDKTKLNRFTDAERALQGGGVESNRLLEEARSLQRQLQDLARRILTSQEEERLALSLMLQDEIAQTLLGVQFRLLALQSETSVSASAFQNEIGTTRRLVQKANMQLKVMLGRLTRRTDELATATSELQGEITQRQAVEASLRAREITPSRLLEKSRLMQEELRLLSRRLLTVQEEERKRISRELNHVIGRTLTEIHLRLAMLRSRSTTSAKELHRKIALTQRLLAKAVAIVHRFARDLRPAVLDDLGLIPALQSYIKGFRKETGLGVTFTAFAGVEEQDRAVRTVLYRVAQEVLSNVARHAGASHAVVRIAGRKGGVGMEITDDGQGSQVERVLFAKTNQGLGVPGLRERVEMVGGTFCAESALGKATIIRVEFPHCGTATKLPRRKSRRNTLTHP